MWCQLSCFFCMPKQVLKSNEKVEQRFVADPWLLIFCYTLAYNCQIVEAVSCWRWQGILRNFFLTSFTVIFHLKKCIFQKNATKRIYIQIFLFKNPLSKKGILKSTPLKIHFQNIQVKTHFWKSTLWKNKLLKLTLWKIHFWQICSPQYHLVLNT